MISSLIMQQYSTGSMSSSSYFSFQHLGNETTSNTNYMQSALALALGKRNANVCLTAAYTSVGMVTKGLRSPD